jgi:hypothetical protein
MDVRGSAIKHLAKTVGTLGFIVLALLAFTVPAGGAVRPDDRAGLRGVPAAAAVAVVRPDDRAGFRGGGVTSLSTSVRPDDRAGTRGVVDEPETVAVGTDNSVRRTESGFDWAAALAGAGAAIGVLLLLASALTLRRNHRRAKVPV